MEGIEGWKDGKDGEMKGIEGWIEGKGWRDGRYRMDVRDGRDRGMEGWKGWMGVSVI